MIIKYPDPLLEIRSCFLDAPALISLCAGYEAGSWRSKALADHIFQWIPFVALDQESQLSLGAHNFLEMIERAAAHIYKTKKSSSRGELGEILLHLACVTNFNTFPILCKLILKTSSNDTVKGFDGIHVLAKESGIELWLGESKFYGDPKAAIREAVTSIKDHIVPAFMNTEKAMVVGHVGEGVPRRDEVLELFRKQTSLDRLFEIAVFPILIAYESKSVSSFDRLCDEYRVRVEEETIELRKYFFECAKNIPLKFQLIFVPIHNKQDVIAHFDKRLESFV
ncbi:uncharacterized protein DUF1837 [Pseudomonas sp. AG1028]|uniref:HamA C-terminal domain-containing protein n=1 Tax=Pseudomonas sp. AG1028 TaxID=2572911 RepID=UPI0011AD8F1E|nr:DUF1837 domain-containing protein [Pseudomonas sp. AG1028]TWE05935.1 uncharacterized protein DUF1837 [Pseudomonas sp. AG1028]